MLGVEGDETFLDSPVYSAVAGRTYCITFRYVLSAMGVGELKLLLIDNQQQMRNIWGAYDLQGLQVDGQLL